MDQSRIVSSYATKTLEAHFMSSEAIYAISLNNQQVPRLAQMAKSISSPLCFVALLGSFHFISRVEVGQHARCVVLVQDIGVRKHDPTPLHYYQYTLGARFLKPTKNDLT